MDNKLHLKLKDLKSYIKNLNKIAVAYSSGVDSTFLLKVAHDILQDNVLAITVKSEIFPKHELEQSIQFCNQEGIHQVIYPFDALSINGFSSNPQNRCYLCKKELFNNIISVANNYGFSHICEGSNVDDLSDYRPGLKAIQELNIKSPLREVDLYKSEIRELSKELGLKTWDKPSFACLSSRFVYGETITKDKLSRVERAENYLLSSGFTQFRVRIHGENLARIEILPSEFEKLLSIRTDLIEKFKYFGFDYISMDLLGYRTGSMNIF